MSDSLRMFFFPSRSLASIPQDRSPPQVRMSKCIYNTPTWISTIKMTTNTSTSTWTCNSTSGTTTQTHYSQCPSWPLTAQEHFFPTCRPRLLLQIKTPRFRAVLEIIVSTVTVGRCRKSGHICCTAQPGSCIWWLLALQDATYAPNKLFWFPCKHKFFDWYVWAIHVFCQSNSKLLLYTDNSPQKKNQWHFTIIFKGLHFCL